MSRTIAIGKNNFEEIRNENLFYVDKTDFIRQWWESGPVITQIMRPRRFGKTLLMRTVEQFFSVKYKGRGDLFEGLHIWENEKYRAMQGTYPVLYLSLDDLDFSTFQEGEEAICNRIRELFRQNQFLLDREDMRDYEKDLFCSVAEGEGTDSLAEMWLKELMQCLHSYYQKDVIMIIDACDAPLWRAYEVGCWKEMGEFLLNLYECTYKTNEYLERGLIAGITRVPRPGMFSGFNNLVVNTTLSGRYADCFGFTQEEVDAALEEFGLSDQRKNVKQWYDGFLFNKEVNLYNPWSIVNFLKERKIDTYLTHESDNALVENLIRYGYSSTKDEFAALLEGKYIEQPVCDEVIYNEIFDRKDSIWGFLLANGYCKAQHVDDYKTMRKAKRMYHLALPNKEVKQLFKMMVRGWFSKPEYDMPLTKFIDGLLDEDEKKMSTSLHDLAISMYSFFNGDGRAENFYHGFMLGFCDRIKERLPGQCKLDSDYGSFNLILKPKDPDQDPILLVFIEFFSMEHISSSDKTLEDTVQRAFEQIQKKEYTKELLEKGYEEERIREYVIAFRDKEVLIRKKQ